MKPFVKFALWTGAALVALFFTVRLIAYFRQQRALKDTNPLPDQLEASLVSAARDTAGLRALFTVLPPSAQGVRTTVNLTDLNPLGGNRGDVPLETQWRWSPLGG